MKAVFRCVLGAGVLGLSVLAANVARADEEMDAATKACRPEIKRLCGDVKPGEGRRLACLSKRIDEVSADCKAAIKAVREKEAAESKK